MTTPDPRDDQTAALAEAIAAGVEAAEGDFLQRMEGATGARVYEAGNLVFREEFLYFFLAAVRRWLAEAAPEKGDAADAAFDAVARSAAERTALGLVTPRLEGRTEAETTSFATAVADELLRSFRGTLPVYAACGAVSGEGPASMTDEGTCTGVLARRIADQIGRREDMLLRSAIGVVAANVLHLTGLQAQAAALVSDGGPSS